MQSASNYYFSIQQSKQCIDPQPTHFAQIVFPLNLEFGKTLLGGFSIFA
jgi:hypothetical protein